MNRTVKENITGYFFILPFMIVFIIFLGWPVIYSFILSFKEATIYTDWYDVFGKMEIVGFDNYATILKDKEFWWSIISTFIYALLTIPTGIIAALLLALVLNNKLKGTSFFRSAFFLPNVLDLLVIGTIWTLIFAPKYGLLDFLMQKIGVYYFSEHAILNEPWTILPAIAVAMVLKGMGFGMILFLTSIQNISESVYEAADIDGANWFQKTVHITIPLVKPIILFMIITGIIGTLNAFTEIYAMTNDTGGPAISVMGESVKVAKLSGYHLFRTFKSGFYGKAAAISYILLIIAAIISIINAKFIKVEK